MKRDKKKQMKKTIVAITMSLAMAGSMYSGMPLNTYAAEQTTVYYDGSLREVHTSGDYQYVLLGKKAVIVKYLGTDSSVAIPSTIDGFAVTAIGYDAQGKKHDDYVGAFESNAGIQSVVIPESVELIDIEAFRNCDGLQQVVVGSGVRKIADGAFRACDNVQNIRFSGNKLEEIGAQAFYYDLALDEVVLPESLVKLGNEAFRNCSSLSSIVIPDSVTEMGGAVFASCSSLANVTIGDGVTYLYCVEQRGEGLGSDENKAGSFEGCTSLATVTIGSGLTGIGTDAFAGSGLVELQIPDNVELINNGAFDNCDSLTKVTVGNGVKNINDYAFWSCGALKEISIGKKVKSIGTEAFKYCEALEKIVIPSNVSSLGAGAFAGCSSMKEASVGNGVKALVSVYRKHADKPLGTGAEYYYDGTFENCTALQKVTIGNGVTSIGADVFAGTALIEVDIPDNVLTMENGVFYQCKDLEKVMVGDGVKSIGDRTFFECSSLKDVKIGKGVTSIGTEAFRYCTALEELNLPSNITSVGGGLCAGDTSLKKVIIGNGITSLKHNYRQYVDNPLHTGIEAYYDGAFEGCTALSGVAVGSGLTSIGIDTFSNTAVDFIFIPKKVSTIDKGAFYNTYVESMYFAGAAPTFGASLFGTASIPTMYKLAGKTGFDNTDYVFNDFEPITVKFDSNGVLSTLVSDQIMAPNGGYVIEPIPLSAENYIFLGWYSDKEGTDEWDFMNDKVTEDTTLYAKWVKTSEAVPEQSKISDVYEATDTTATIYWQAVSGATEYNIYVDGVKIGNTTDENCSYKLMNLVADTSYEIAITAVNEIGESEQSLIKVIQTAVESEEPDDAENPDDSDNSDNSAIVLGDVTGDKKVELADAQKVLKAALKITTLKAEEIEAADVNQDNVVDLKDARSILKYALKIITKF